MAGIYIFVAYDAFLAFSRVSSIETVHISEEVTPNAPYPPISSSDHIRNAIGLAYDFKHQKMFYSDVQLGTVNSVYFNGSNFSVIAEKQGSVEGLYYEAAHSDLYWTCSNDASINRINPYQPGAKVEKILKLSSNDKPRGVAVDPCDSRIYWTNWDMNKPSIQRAFMSGYSVESIITTEIRMPNGLTLDHPARKLYWVDARLDKIERCELDGSGRKIIASEKPKHAFSIAVLHEFGMSYFCLVNRYMLDLYHMSVKNDSSSCSASFKRCLKCGHSTLNIFLNKLLHSSTLMFCYFSLLE